LFLQIFRAIRQVDKKFDQEAFVQFLESEMIPIILEAKAINDVSVIEDWCLDAPAQRFAIKHREQAKNKITYYEKTINLQKLEILDGTVHDNMPAFQISFETNTLMAYTDKDGKVIEQEGYPKVSFFFLERKNFHCCLQPDEVYKSYHVWSVCRDPMEPEPSAAWRVLECETMDQKLAF
jgi:import inner membrane translocase subunit TIM44